VYDDELNLVAGGVGRPPGRQTVPRAELWGAIQAIMGTAAVRTTLLLDATYVLRGIAGITAVPPAVLAKRPNADLWRQAQAAVEGRFRSIDFKKIKSHPKDHHFRDPVFSELPRGAWGANAAADHLADEAAARAQVPAEVVADYAAMEEKAWAIVQRVAAIVKEKGQQQQQERQKEAAVRALRLQMPLVRLLRLSRHKLRAMAGGRYWCHTCRRFSPPSGARSPAAGIRFRAWLGGECCMGPSSAHTSHTVVVGSWGVGCRQCGVWSPERLGKLRQTCPPQPRTRAAGDVAARLRRGLAPGREAHGLDVS